jgi:hypothetical protein
VYVDISEKGVVVKPRFAFKSQHSMGQEPSRNEGKPNGSEPMGRGPA